MRLASERRAAILRAARLRGSVRVTDIAEKLGVSTVTIRRDVTALVQEGVLARVHGGAVLTGRRAPTKGSRGSRGSAPEIRATVGMVVPSANYYYPGVIRGVEAASVTHGVRLILAISNYYPQEDRRHVDRMLELGVDGLLLTTSTAPDSDSELSAWLGSIPVPTVLVERQADPATAARVDHVRTDHAAGAIAAIRHLADVGHRRVALAVRHDSPTSTGVIEGHAAAVAMGMVEDISLAPTLLPREDSDPLEREKVMIRLVEQCRASGIGALLVHNDQDAMAVCRASLALGLNVPADLALVAYDDEVAAVADVPLTAVGPLKQDVGRLALEVLMHRLTRGEDAPAQHLSLQPRLVVRSSSGQ